MWSDGLAIALVVVPQEHSTLVVGGARTDSASPSRSAASPRRVRWGANPGCFFLAGEAQLSDPNPVERDYVLLRTLGRGGEGVVHLARERATGTRVVLKVRHRGIRGAEGASLRAYARAVRENPHGLPPITLVGRDDEIAAVAYRYVPLYPMHGRILAHSERTAQAMFGTFCRMQAFLLDLAELSILDTGPSNFMLTRRGAVHYVDVGWGIRLARNESAVDRGGLGFAFAMMLLGVHNIEIQRHALPRPGYSHDQPCVYCNLDVVVALARGRPWVAEVLRQVRTRKADVFFDSGLYTRLAASLPPSLPYRPLVGAVNTALHYVGRARRRLTRGAGAAT